MSEGCKDSSDDLKSHFYAEVEYISSINAKKQSVFIYLNIFISVGETMKYIARKFLHLMHIDRGKYFHQKYSGGKLDLVPHTAAN